MMEFELIGDEDYLSLPSEPAQRFVAAEAICRRNLARFIAHEDDNNYNSFVRIQYMATVAAFASELGIAGVEFPERADNPDQLIGNFVSAAAAAAARIRIRPPAQDVSDALSVRLARGTKARIEIQIAKLRDLIAESNLPADRKSALADKLDELSKEVAGERLGFGKTLAVLAYVSAVVAANTSFLADAPGAISTITRLIGVDKEAEDAEMRCLGAPPAQKAIAPPKKENLQPSEQTQKASRGQRVINRDLDDEIPF